jgi:sugar lactone lactonase YvrE
MVDYGWFLGIDDTAPMLETATYRFNPNTGAVNIVEDSAVQPNGIARSPDGTKIYIADTGAANGLVEQSLGSQGFSLNATGKRVIYAYDVCDNGLSITNKRTIYQALDFGADGLKVAQNGLIVTATGKGFDVLDEVGTPIIRVQTNYSVENFAWTGNELKTLWLTGAGGISKVEWNLQGQRLM